MDPLLSIRIILACYNGNSFESLCKQAQRKATVIIAGTLWVVQSSLAKPQPLTSASSWMCIANSPQHAVVVLQSPLLQIWPSPFHLHRFLLYPFLQHMAHKSRVSFSPSAPDLKAIIPLRDSMLVILWPECCVVSSPVLAETRKRSLSISKIHFLR